MGFETTTTEFTNRLNYQSRSSTCTQSHVCTATPVSLFVQCQITFQLFQDFQIVGYCQITFWLLHFGHFPLGNVGYAINKIQRFACSKSASFTTFIEEGLRFSSLLYLMLIWIRVLKFVFENPIEVNKHMTCAFLQ